MPTIDTRNIRDLAEQAARRRSNELRIAGITNAKVNGRKVKIFTVREKIGSAWVHYGKFTAPARTPNRELLGHIPAGD